ncbi:sugar phosphate nucleotidyltransferase [Desulfonatronum thioautotrophicum]|uniref:sugar phosphate nucleotidyltransferase n=1 Tax=Desulfonatronum thioautotrophicum TaxID=617001 RepID=UPI0005EB3EB3|nr:NDP-sugar synthase [Desulfonatronum thioautotrophicum]
MKAVIHTGTPAAWAAPLGPTPWALLPFGNRPLLEYWLEWCVELGIREVRLVLDEGADRIEAYAGEGERWGLNIAYSFQRQGRDPAAFLRRAPQEWSGQGLLVVHGPVFPRKADAAADGQPSAQLLSGEVYQHRDRQGFGCMLCTDRAFLERFLLDSAAAPDESRPFTELGREMLPISSVALFHDLNMRLVSGEMERYLRPGYSPRDQAAIGFNVITPATATLTPPLVIGNNCRISPLTTIGPRAVLGSHVIVDRQTEITEAVILDGTFIGRGMEIRGKIVSGNMVVDPESGAAVAIPDPWMVGTVQRLPGPKELTHRLFSRTLAALIALTQTIPFAMLFGWLLTRGATFAVRPVRGRKGGTITLPVFSAPSEAEGPALRLFIALGLDSYPQFLQAVAGRLWLCGHRPKAESSPPDTLPAKESPDDMPVPFPAVLSYADLRDDTGDPLMDRVEEHYYSHHRTMLEDLRILSRFMARRFAGLFGS